VLEELPDQRPHERNDSTPMISGFDHHPIARPPTRSDTVTTTVAPADQPQPNTSPRSVSLDGRFITIQRVAQQLAPPKERTQQSCDGNVGQRLRR
jgi:hypothetical protein